MLPIAKCIVAHQIRSALNAVVEWEHGTCALSFTWLATPFKLLPLKNEIRATACVCVFFCKQYQSHQLHDAQKVLRMRKLTRFQSLSPCTSVDWMRAVDSTKGEWSNGFLFDCEMGYKFRRRKNTHQSPNGFYHPWYHSPTFSFHLISYTTSDNGRSADRYAKFTSLSTERMYKQYSGVFYLMFLFGAIIIFARLSIHSQSSFSQICKTSCVKCVEHQKSKIDNVHESKSKPQ